MTNKPWRTISFATAIAFPLCMHIPEARAEPDMEGYPKISDGYTTLDGEILVTNNVAGVNFLISFIRGFDLGRHAFLHSLGWGMGLGGIKQDGSLAATFNGDVTTYVSLEPPKHGCHTTTLFWGFGFRSIVMLKGDGEEWPIYIGPSFGPAVITEVDHDLCHTFHDWSSGFDVGVFSISYVVLTDLSRSNLKRTPAYGAIIKALF
jgi:hypothetical protein